MPFAVRRREVARRGEITHRLDNVLMRHSLSCAAIGIFAICKDYGTMSPAIATAVLLSVLAAVILLLSVIHPRLKRLKAERGDLKQTIAQHKDEAWEQMAPLNRLYGGMC